MSDANIEIATQVSDSSPAANSWSVVWGDYTLNSLNNVVSINQLTGALFGNYDFEKNLYNGRIIGMSNQLRTFSGDAADYQIIDGYSQNNVFHQPCDILRPSNEGIAVKNAAGIRTDYVLHGQQAARNAGALTLPKVPNTLAYWNCDLSHRRLCVEPVMRLCNYANITPYDYTTDNSGFMRLEDYEAQVLLLPGVAAMTPYLYDHQLATQFGLSMADVVALFPFERTLTATLMVDVSNTCPAGYTLAENGTGAISDALVRYVHKMSSLQDWSFGLFMASLGLEFTGYGSNLLTGVTYRVYTPEYSFGSHLISFYSPNDELTTPIGQAEFALIQREVAFCRHLITQYILQSAGSALGIATIGFSYAVQRRATWNMWISTALSTAHMPWVPWELMSVYRSWTPKDIRSGILHPSISIPVATNPGLYRSKMYSGAADRTFYFRGSNAATFYWNTVPGGTKFWIPIAQTCYTVEEAKGVPVTSRVIQNSKVNDLELPSVSETDDWLPQVSFLDLN